MANSWHGLRLAVWAPILPRTNSSEILDSFKEAWECRQKGIESLTDICETALAICAVQTFGYDNMQMWETYETGLVCGHCHGDFPRSRA